MKFTKLLLSLFSVALLLSPGCASPGRGNRLESWQTANSPFNVRVTSYAEKGAFLPGTYYVFESAQVGTDVWREFMVFRHDDRPALPTDQIRFMNERIGFVFMGWMFAVTTDGGINWTVWDSGKDLPNWLCCNYDLIRDVNIAKDGRGVMRMNPIHGRSGEVPELRSDDYGRHWRAE